MSKPIRTFASTKNVSVFIREHMDGIIFATFVKGDKWRASVVYNGKTIGTGGFPRIREVEAWAIGVLRKERKNEA